jgi:hypothetical protein
MFLQFKKDLFGDGLQGLEDAFPGDGDGFELRHFSRIQDVVHVSDRYDVRKVSFVVLDSVRKFFEFISLINEVYLKIVETFHIGFHSLHLAVCNKYNAVNAFKDKLSAGGIKDLSRNRIKMEPYSETLNVSKGQREEIEKKRPLCFGC